MSCHHLAATTFCLCWFIYVFNKYVVGAFTVFSITAPKSFRQPRQHQGCHSAHVCNQFEQSKFSRMSGHLGIQIVIIFAYPYCYAAKNVLEMVTKAARHRQRRWLPLCFCSLLTWVIYFQYIKQTVVNYMYYRNTVRFLVHVIYEPIQIVTQNSIFVFHSGPFVYSNHGLIWVRLALIEKKIYFDVNNIPYLYLGKFSNSAATFFLASSWKK